MIELGSKLSQKAFQEAGKGAAGKGSSSASGSGNGFGNALERAQGKDVNEVVKALNNELDIKPLSEVSGIQSQSLENIPTTGEVQGRTTAGSKIAEILGGVNDGQNKLQRLVDLISSGQKMSPQELIAVEAGVFSLVQELELVGKATQEATQGVRQTLNTNLG